MNYDVLFTQSHGMNQKTLTIDGVELSFEPGQTIMEAATASGVSEIPPVLTSIPCWCRVAAEACAYPSSGSC